MTELELAQLCELGPSAHKLSSFDLAWAVAKGWTGSTTVAGTMRVAAMVGISTFATGGIGGVHRGWQTLPDISHDLEALATDSLAVVCAGAKAILDLPATYEWLETRGVLCVGYDCQEFPAFYYRDSGLKLKYQTNELSELSLAYSLLGKGSLLVLNPVAKESELARSQIEPLIRLAIEEAERQGVVGKDVTPFLLQYLAEKTDHASVRCNMALIESNVRLGAKLAVNLAQQSR